jgi:1D-myo-inositol-tetrakisphosphate 5-kinase/inositol-polyphosphate multikinase
LIVIENIAHGFQKPNTIDIKLGTVLYDEDAPPEKKERMEIKARSTTSGDTGIRLTGFQVRRGPFTQNDD